MNHADFAILPPFFKCESGESRMEVDRVIEQLFPNLDAKKKYIAEQAIAAVVYHQDWLRKTMPANHPLFETELFSYHEFLPLLSRYISIDGNGRKPTGLPPHVMTIRSMEEMKGSVDGMNGNITEMRGSINHLTETNATMEEKLAACFRTSADSIFRAIAENRPLANSLQSGLGVGGTGVDAGVKAAAEDTLKHLIEVVWRMYDFVTKTRDGDGKLREEMDAKMQGMQQCLQVIQDTLEEMKGSIKELKEGMKDEISRAVSVSLASTGVRRRLGVRHGRDRGRESRSVTDDVDMEDVLEDAQDDGGEVEDETVNDKTAQGDESRLLPISFKWVKANTRAIYTQWHFGNREKGYPGYKTLKPCHLYTKDQKKRLSDLRYLVREIEIEARALGVYVEQPDGIDGAGFMYDQCENFLMEIYKEARGEWDVTSRFGHLSWMTVVDLLRKSGRGRRMLVEMFWCSD